MITEDYVSLDVALLLNKKKFNEETSQYYLIANGERWPYVHYHDFDRKDIILCPTIQMAMKWLREEHNLFIEPRAGETNGKTWYDFDIIPINGRKIAWNHYNNFPFVECNSCEEACEAAIKYCLENLI